MKKSIRIGKSLETSKILHLTPEDRSTHMQIIGASGEGKSKFMEYMIREDILNRSGLCLIDPHGYLYNDIVKWCEYEGFIYNEDFPRKIILFEPAKDNWSFGFNPLKTGATEISYHVDSMVKAVAKVWGGEDSDKTPLLKRILRIIFHILAEQNLTLLEAYLLISPVRGDFRKYLTDKIKDDIIREQWAFLSDLPPTKFNEQVGSSINRLMEFLASPIIRNIVGQLENTIDFQKVMDEGQIVLVNLASSDKLSEDNAQLLGTLLVNEIWLKARRRKKESKPFYLYIDECSLFINNDIARILDEGRKFGIHLILAHQHLDQLKRVGDIVYKSVLTDAKIKIIFGGLSYEDAEILAKQIFLGELNLQEFKECVTKFQVVGYTKELLKGFTDSRAKSHTLGVTETDSVSGGDGTSSQQSIGGFQTGLSLESFIPLTTGVNNSYSDGSSSYNSYSDSYSKVDLETTSDSHSDSISESVVPILEEQSTQTYSLEEQIYKSIVSMVNQPARQFILKIAKKSTKFVVAPFVKDYSFIRDSRATNFKNRCFNETKYCNLSENVQKLLKERQNSLLEKAIPKPPKDF